MSNTSMINELLVRHSLLTKAAAMGLIAAALVIFAVLPLINTTQSTLPKIAAKEIQATELANKVSILSGLDQQVLMDRVTILDLALPPRKDLLAYLSSVEGLSTDLGLSFGGISLAPGDVTQASGSAAKTKPGLHTLETAIKVSGSRDNIYTFLKSVEQTLPLMQIKDVKITIGKDSTFTLALNLGMLWADASVGNVQGKITLFTDKEEAYFSKLESYKTYASLTAQSATASAAVTGPRDLFTNQ